MSSLRVTNLLLLFIAITSTASFVLTLVDRPAAAETFQLDTCITPKVSDKPAAFLHVVTHEPGRSLQAASK